jgi:spore coat polysaccharide biosynthesis protein SpsF
MKTVVIIQARMGSTRLPGKVLKALAGRSVLSHVIERVKAAPSVDAVVIATTTAPADEAIVAEAERCGAAAFRGSEDDVLSRYQGAARQAGADVVVRVTSDCPLLDAQVLEAMIARFKAERPDYLSNTQTRTYPRGLDVEIFTMAALDRAHREADKPHQREHVTPYLYQHPELFELAGFAHDTDHSNHRWTLDTDEDYALIEAIFDGLVATGEPVTTEAVLAFLAERPELVAINAHVEQKKVGE